MVRMCKHHVLMISLERVACVSKLSQGKERFVRMVWEDFYFLGRGRHVNYRYIAMMLLRQDLIIGHIYVDGGRGSGFWIF